MSNELPLGLGMATVMRHPNKRGQLALLDEASASGYSHIDVAPTYGLGSAERVVGEWLRYSSADLTVATKVGLLPSRGAMIVASVQGPIRRLMQMSPPLRSMIVARGTRALRPAPPPTAVEISSSVERSLDLIGRPLDLLLLHEVAAEGLTAEVVNTLQRLVAQGSVHALGASGPAELAVRSSESLGDKAVVQSVIELGRRPLVAAARSEGRRVHYGLLSRHLGRLAERCNDPSACRRVEDETGLPFRNPRDAAELLLRLALSLYPQDLILIGSSQVGNIKRMAAVATEHAECGPMSLSSIEILQALLRSDEGEVPIR